MRRLFAVLLLAFAIAPAAALAGPATGCFCAYLGADGYSHCVPSSVTASEAYCRADCKFYYNGTEQSPEPGIYDADRTIYTTTEESTELERERCFEVERDIAQVLADTAPTTEDTVTYRPLQKPKLDVPVPNLTFSDAVATSSAITSNFLGEYVNAVFKYLLGIATLIAIVLVMVGGLQYVVGATTGEIGKAKERIKNAIEGLVLLMCVYLILYTVNPETAQFASLKLKYIPEIPVENQFEPFGPDAMACTSGTTLTGVNDFQDCMLANYGQSESEVKSKLVSVKHKNRTYQVHELAKADFEAAFAAIDASGVNYDITWDTSGGSFNWRCNKNYPAAVSPHGWGSAIDVNPSVNPNCPKSCRDDNASTACSCVGGNDKMSCAEMCAQDYHDIPPEVVNAFRNNHFNWGGDWTNTKDWMHFTHNRICKGG